MGLLAWAAGMPRGIPIFAYPVAPFIRSIFSGKERQGKNGRRKERT